MLRVPGSLVVCLFTHIYYIDYYCILWLHISSFIAFLSSNGDTPTDQSNVHQTPPIADRLSDRLSIYVGGVFQIVIKSLCVRTENNVCFTCHWNVIGNLIVVSDVIYKTDSFCVETLINVFYSIVQQHKIIHYKISASCLGMCVCFCVHIWGGVMVSRSKCWLFVCLRWWLRGVWTPQKRSAEYAVDSIRMRWLLFRQRRRIANRRTHFENAWMPSNAYSYMS